MLRLLKKLSRLKKLITLVDLDSKFGTKGKTSGFTQKVLEIRIDDDQDSVWLTVDIGDGSSCHVGYRSCFYRSIPLGTIENGREIEMKFEEKEKSFDPEVVYKGQPQSNKNLNE